MTNLHPDIDTLIPRLTVAEVESIWSAIQALAPEEIRQPVDEAAPTEALVTAIESGDSLHEALRGLAWRGWSVEQLQALMMRSAARTADPKRWKDRFDDIPRYVESAHKKRADDAKRVLGPPVTALPVGARALGEPAPFDPNSAAPKTPDEHLKEAKKIGKGAPEIDTRPTILTIAEMIDRLVYVESTGAIVDTGTCRARKNYDLARRAFKASKEKWVNPNTGEFKEVEAIKLWEESESRKSVDVITWSPALPTMCHAPEREEGGIRAVNLWGGWDAPPVPDDWQAHLGPWHEHLAFLIQDEAERFEFEKFCAHIAQKPGELPHRFYLMIAKDSQGVGRNWLTCVLARVFRGHVAAGVKLGDLFKGGFTGRLGRKVLVTVDEVKEGIVGGSHKNTDALKDLITIEQREINPKYGIQSIQYNCARWIMLSNHMDAIPIEKMDRRAYIIMNPSKPRDAAYYQRIYAAINDWRFIGAVWEHLRTLDISDFDAQKPAPMTETKRAVLSELESEVAKAIRRFFEEWPAAVVDRRTLLAAVTADTGSREPHSKHFSYCLKEVGALVRTGRVKLHGRNETVVGMGLTQPELDGLTSFAIREIIEQAKANTTFEV